MSGGRLKRWQRAAAIVLLMVAGIEGLDLAVKTAPLPASASRFLQYYEALEQRAAVSLWERVLYSSILAGVRERPGAGSASSQATWSFCAAAEAASP